MFVKQQPNLCPSLTTTAATTTTSKKTTKMAESVKGKPKPNDPKALLLLSSTNPNFETNPDHYWDAIVTNAKKPCKITQDLIPAPLRNGLRSGMAFGHGKLFLCMGSIHNETFNPFEYTNDKFIDSYRDCHFLDLDQEGK